MKSWIRRHPLAAFCLLAFAISWAIATPFALRERGLLSFAPAPLLESLVAFGPAIAAFVVLSCIDGAAGRAQLWRSMRAWRIGKAAFFLAAVMPLLLLAGAYLAVSWKGGGWLLPEADAIFATPAWGVALLAAALSGPGEEPGWRGFALRTVQKRHSALTAALIIGVLWWIWHLPMFLYRVDVHPAQALLFLVGLLAGSVWASAVFNASGGSVFAAILWHCVWNLASAIGRDFPAAVFVLMSSTVLVLAVLLIILWGPARLAPGSPRTS